MTRIARLLLPLCAAACATPRVAATPIAYGDQTMLTLAPNVVVDPATTGDERARLELDYAAAAARVAEALGPWRSELPLAIFCKSDPCKLYFAGPARRSWTLAPGDHEPGGAYVAGSRLTVLVMRVDPGARGVLAHEMVHAELHHRLRRVRVPQWFHEGIASVIGGAPECATPLPPGVDDLRRLDLNESWAAYTNERGTLIPTYCQARAEVAAWLQKFGAARVVALVEALRGGGAFYDLYGAMLTQPSGAMPAVVVSPASELGDGRSPFSLALWIKPAAPGGVIAHASYTATGVGWCNPLIGYDSAQRLISQVLHGNGPEPANYSVATAPSPLAPGQWSHVVMTWAPGSSNRLYVNGREVAATAAPTFNAQGRYLTWGSSNIGGANCWQGAIVPGRFQGALAGMRIYPVELSAEEIAKIAAAGL